MYLLDVVDLTKRFDGLRAVEDVNFRIKEGSIVSIIGPNGAGKTTLFNCLTGITKPTKGAIHFSETDITGLSPYCIVSLGIARTFQNIRLFKEMSVLENVLVSQHLRIKTGMLGAIIRDKNFLSQEEEAKEKALEYLAFAGIDNMAGAAASSLPYGDQRRLEIARALATEPVLLLLDEPTAGMNPLETSGVMEIIKRIRSLGKTVILIEHDMKVVMGISDTVIVLDHGVKIAEGTPDEVRNNHMVIEAYLGKQG